MSKPRVLQEYQVLCVPRYVNASVFPHAQLNTNRVLKWH